MNDPWNWTTAQPILDAGKENEEGKTQRVEAMEEARTQHRQKTASGLGGLAEAVVEEKWDEELNGSLSGLIGGFGGEIGCDKEVVEGEDQRSG